MGSGCWGQFVEKDCDDKTNSEAEVMDVCVFEGGGEGQGSLYSGSLYQEKG